MAQPTPSEEFAAITEAIKILTDKLVEHERILSEHENVSVELKRDMSSVIDAIIKVGKLAEVSEDQSRDDGFSPNPFEIADVRNVIYELEGSS